MGLGREEGMEKLQYRFWDGYQEWKEEHQDIWREKSCEKINYGVKQREERRDLRRGCRRSMRAGQVLGMLKGNKEKVEKERGNIWIRKGVE